MRHFLATRFVRGWLDVNRAELEGRAPFLAPPRFPACSPQDLPPELRPLARSRHTAPRASLRGSAPGGSSMVVSGFYAQRRRTMNSANTVVMHDVIQPN